MTHILVLGGGPAGYVAAGRAAQLGATVTLVEKDALGGTCLNRGCIPTKAMVAGANRLRQLREAAEFGIRATDLGVDFGAFMARTERVTSSLRDGVAGLLRARKVEVVQASATLVNATTLRLNDGRELNGDATILATGSEPIRLGLFNWADLRVMSSDELLKIDRLPPTLAIVGGGVIGCEFASTFATLGTQVTVIELFDQLLPEESRRSARALQQALVRAGVDLRLGSAVAGAEHYGESDDLGDESSGLTLQLTNGDEVKAAAVLVAVGRRASSRGLGFGEAGVALDERGFVVVDQSLRTSLEGVFAAGDVCGPPMLAHWAYHQGMIAAENAVMQSELHYDRRVVPSVVFSVPEIASCGLTEEQADIEGRSFGVAHVRLNGNSKAVVDGHDDGFVRIVYDSESGVLLGASVVGLHASELIHELALAIHAKLTLTEVMRTIHAHPTVSEAISEAVHAALGRGIHTLER